MADSDAKELILLALTIVTVAIGLSRRRVGDDSGICHKRENNSEADDSDE